MQSASVRFDKNASNYVTSEVHVTSPTVRRLHELLGLKQELSVCDVACGAGHTGLSFAGRASRLVFVDPAPAMLERARTLAEERGTAVSTVHAFAEAIPLPSNSFDVVVSRLAPHHFGDIEAAVREMARIAKPEGFVSVIDLEGDADPSYDDFNHRLEVLHDPTHVRSYTASRWRGLLEEAGLVVECMENQLSERPEGVTVKRWCEIASSGEAAEIEIRRLLGEATEETLAALGIVRSGNEFLMPVRTVLLLGRKPNG